MYIRIENVMEIVQRSLELPGMAEERALCVCVCVWEKRYVHRYFQKHVVNDISLHVIDFCVFYFIYFYLGIQNPGNSLNNFLKPFNTFPVPFCFLQAEYVHHRTLNRNTNILSLNFYSSLKRLFHFFFCRFRKHVKQYCWKTEPLAGSILLIMPDLLISHYFKVTHHFKQILLSIWNSLFPLTWSNAIYVPKNSTIYDYCKYHTRI